MIFLEPLPGMIPAGDPYESVLHYSSEAGLYNIHACTEKSKVKEDEHESAEDSSLMEPFEKRNNRLNPVPSAART